jgi:hypothetical protein
MGFVKMQEKNTQEINPLTKYHKLKRFAAHVSDSMRQVIDAEGLRRIDGEIALTDCLNNGDIYTARDMWEKLDAIAECASLVELRKYDDGKVTIHNANFCHNPVVCPVCADRVSRRRKAIFSDPLKKASRKYAVDRSHVNWKPSFPLGYTGVYLATATIKDSPNLKERIDTLLDSIKRMRKMGQKRSFGRSGGEWAKVKAGISNVEIKIGSGSEQWHVHCHFLIFTDAPIDIRSRESSYLVTKKDGSTIAVSKFNYEWWQATGGEGINFDVRPIVYKRDVNGIDCETMEESIAAQASEVLKYSTLLSKKKGAGLMDAAQYVELIQRRGSRRLFNTIGVLRCDSRNPDSLITISERELKRLEYVESIDAKHYEVFSAQWQSGGSYSTPIHQDGAIFASSDDIATQHKNLRRKCFMAQTAKYQGEYRKARGYILKNRTLHNCKEEFEKLLNTTRDMFRNKVASLWRNYNVSSFLPEFLCDFNSEGILPMRETQISLLSAV